MLKSFLIISETVVTFFLILIFDLNTILSEVSSILFFPQLAMGKMMDQGPVLIITFQAQLVMVIRNTKGEVVEGDPVGSSHTNRNTNTVEKTYLDWLKVAS